MLNNKYLITLLTLVSFNVFAIDKAFHKYMTDTISSYTLALESTTPNKALVYMSERDKPDAIGIAEVLIDSPNVTDGQVIITRPLATLDPTRMKVAISLVTKCQADYGTVDIQPSGELIVYTDRLPVRVRCENSDGSYRESYKTMFK